MSVVILRFKDGDDPTGAVLGTLTDAEISGFKLRVALRGIGMASFSISRTHPSATSALIAKGNYVDVTIPSIDADPVWGFWLWEGQFNLLDAQGDDTLTFSGPGPLGILRDAMLRYEIYAPGQTARGSSSGVDGMWFWRNEPYGAILTRIIEEGQNEPGTPLSPVTIDFDRDNDSASVAWPNIDIEYQQPIQSNILKVFEDLRDAGDMFVASTPAFLVQAYSTFGTDRTSATFAAGKVRLQESNILTGLPVHIHATNELTHVHIRDKDGVYSTEVTPGFAGRARYGALDVPETNDPATLTKIGQETLANSTLNTNAFELEVTPGDDEATGRYLPWLHYNVGDTVTVDAETGLFAYVDEDARIVAFRVELDEASDDSTTDTAHRSLHTVMEFNAATSDGAPIEGRQVIGSSGPGCHCLTLCRDGSQPFSEPWEVLIGAFRFRMGTTTQRHSLQWILRDDINGGSTITIEVNNALGGGFGDQLGISDLELSDEDANVTSATPTQGILTTVDDVWCWLRVRVFDNEIHARLWKDGSAEPGTWDVESSDATVTFTDASANLLNRLDINQRNGDAASGSSFECRAIQFTEGYSGQSNTESFTRTVAVGLGDSEWNGDAYDGRTSGLSVDGTTLIDASNGSVAVWGLSFTLTDSCIHGGPNAAAGDSTQAPPANHEHDYAAAGGTVGQVLAKASATDWDTEWVTPASGDSSFTSIAKWLTD